jgi:Holliday junction resolvase
MTEQAFTNELLKWLRVYGWQGFHVRNSGVRGISQVQGDKGFPDLLAIRGERLIAAELKVKKAGTVLGEPKPEQRAWLEAFRRVGAETYVWRPENWSEILAAIAR